jgi:hypothetical protein
LVSFDLGKKSDKEGYIGMTFKFEKDKWINRKRTYEDVLVESLYYRMMLTVWNSYSDDNDEIRKDKINIPPALRRVIIREIKRLKKKVGL